MNYRVYAKLIGGKHPFRPISCTDGDIALERLIIHATHWNTYEQAMTVASRLSAAVRDYQFEVREAK